MTYEEQTNEIARGMKQLVKFALCVGGGIALAYLVLWCAANMLMLLVEGAM